MACVVISLIFVHEMVVRIREIQHGVSSQFHHRLTLRAVWRVFDAPAFVGTCLHPVNFCQPGAFGRVFDTPALFGRVFDTRRFLGAFLTPQRFLTRFDTPTLVDTTALVGVILTW